MGSAKDSTLQQQPAPRSLRELIDRVTGRQSPGSLPAIESGLADTPAFPFLALVGQREMKLALVLSLINPAIGGVLLIGPRGTGKTTAVRSLIELLPQIQRSLCPNGYGCTVEDIEQGGLDAVCPECAGRYGRGEPLERLGRVQLLELPLNAGLNEVVGGWDEPGESSYRYRVRRGVLAQADRNLLYIDEVNLLSNAIVDAVLDAAAQGRYTVRRGPISATYHARFVLIGSMNPEEGQLRSQILDRFGLRLLVPGLTGPVQRLEAYQRVHLYQASPEGMAAAYQSETGQARAEIEAARDMLPSVELPEDIARQGLALIEKLGIDSLRAEITLFEACRALAAAEGRAEVLAADLREIAPLALRLRRSAFMADYFARQHTEGEEIALALNGLVSTPQEDPL